MITKTQFLEALDALVRQNKEDSYISAHFQAICPDSNVLYVTRHANEALLNLLEAATDDADHWVSYWLYDLEQGKKYKPGSVTIGGKKVKLKTPLDLWKVLNMPEKSCSNCVAALDKLFDIIMRPDFNEEAKKKKFPGLQSMKDYYIALAMQKAQEEAVK